MPIFSEKDFADAISQGTKKKQVQDDSERCNKNYAKTRSSLIENLVYGFKIFERVVKEYPQIASLKHVEFYHVETSRYGMFGRPKTTQYDLIPLSKYYNQGFLFDVVLFDESGHDYGSANLFVDQKGNLLYYYRKNIYVGGTEVGLYSSNQFQQLLEKRINPSDYNAMQDVDDALGWHIRLDGYTHTLLIDKIASFTFGGANLIQHPKFEKEYWINTYPFFASLKVERLSDDQIINSVKRYLKSL